MISQNGFANSILTRLHNVSHVRFSMHLNASKVGGRLTCIPLTIRMHSKFLKRGWN